MPEVLFPPVVQPEPHVFEGVHRQVLRQHFMHQIIKREYTIKAFKVSLPEETKKS